MVLQNFVRNAKRKYGEIYFEFHLKDSFNVTEEAIARVLLKILELQKKKACHFYNAFV